MLNAFIVTNTDDQRSMMNILKSCGCERDHTVVCQSIDPRHNVQRINNVLLICDAVSIDSDLVFNCLIDQTRMDQTILVTDENDCKNYFARTNGLDGFVDSRIKAALTERGTKIEFRGGNQVNSNKAEIINKVKLNCTDIVYGHI